MFVLFPNLNYVIVKLNCLDVGLVILTALMLRLVVVVVASFCFGRKM